MAKIHRSDAPLPQAPSVQVKASYTVTDLSKVSPQEPAAFYDQDNDEDYRRRETAKCKKKRGNLLYTLAMIVFAAIFLISGGLLVFVIAKLVILAVPDGIRQVLLVHPMVGKVVCILIMLAFYCGIGAIIMLIL